MEFSPAKRTVSAARSGARIELGEQDWDLGYLWPLWLWVDIFKDIFYRNEILRHVHLFLWQIHIHKLSGWLLVGWLSQFRSFLVRKLKWHLRCVRVHNKMKKILRLQKMCHFLKPKNKNVTKYQDGWSLGSLVPFRSFWAQKLKYGLRKNKKCHKVSFRSDFIQICAMSSWEKLLRANAGSVAEDDVACCLALLVLGLKPNCISEGDYYLLVGTNARASHGCRAPTSFKYRLSKQVWVIFREFMQSWKSPDSIWPIFCETCSQYNNSELAWPSAAQRCQRVKYQNSEN